MTTFINVHRQKKRVENAILNKQTSRFALRYISQPLRQMRSIALSALTVPGQVRVKRMLDAVLSRIAGVESALRQGCPWTMTGV